LPIRLEPGGHGRVVAKRRAFRDSVPEFGILETQIGNLQNQIDNLSAAEKYELLDVLWESLEAHLPALTDEQRAELDCRVASYEQNPSNVLPWEQVRAGLFKKQ
jgi:putative addiction module component (TIGR02574 family)